MVATVGFSSLQVSRMPFYLLFSTTQPSTASPHMQ